MNLKYKIKHFLNNYTPVFCWACHGLFFSKDVTYETNTLYQIVPLCDECHKMLFSPFSITK